MQVKNRYTFINTILSGIMFSMSLIGFIIFKGFIRYIYFGLIFTSGMVFFIFILSMYDNNYFNKKIKRSYFKYIIFVTFIVLIIDMFSISINNFYILFTSLFLGFIIVSLIIKKASNTS